MRKVSRSKFIAILLTIAVAILWIAPTALAAEGPSYGPGRVGLQILEGRDHVAVGTGGIWNSRTNLLIQLDPLDGWRIKSYHADLGFARPALGRRECPSPALPAGAFPRRIVRAILRTVSSQGVRGVILHWARCG